MGIPYHTVGVNVKRTIEIASQSQAFGPRALRAALDSSPLWGAGRVEDTYNLLGHALKEEKVWSSLKSRNKRLFNLPPQ